MKLLQLKNAAHGANLCGIDLNKTITPSSMKNRTDTNDARTKRLLSGISVRGLPLIYKNLGKAYKIDGNN